MTTQKKQKKMQLGLHKPLIATLLAVGGLFSLVGIVLADTAAGTSISNTATATYSNPTTGEETTVESNTVIVTVAEVAGITVQGNGFTEATTADGDGQVDPDEVWYYNYTITNVGNDPTHFRLPSDATVTGPGNIGGSFEYFDPVDSTWKSYTTAETSDAAQFPNFATDGFDAGESLQIRVPILMDDTAAAGAIIAVEFGDTPLNNEQNIDDPTPNAQYDVYTVDLDDANVNDADGAPVNGTREASDILTLTIEESIANKPMALVTLEKILSDYSDAGTSNDIIDDTLTYSLEFTVSDTDPTGNDLQPTSLTGTTIEVDTANGEYILVSDAVPTGTEAKFAPATIPSGWQFVYTTDAVTMDATAASWTTAAAGAAIDGGGTVTRVGFVNQTAIAPGTTVTGFNIALEIVDTATAPLTIANVAQVFGETLGVPDVLVVDESGDQNPSNYNDDGTHPYDTDGSNDGVPETPGTIPDGHESDPDNQTDYAPDPTGNNTATGSPEGEVNVFTLTTTGGTDSVLNGPQGTPDAVGPTGINDDFTNAAAPIDASNTGGDVDFDSTLSVPTAVEFINTIENNGTDSNTYTLEPNDGDTPADLPVNTTVEITDGTETAVYTWSGTTWTTSDTPVTIDLAPSATADYEVTTTLPAGTPISTAPETGDQPGESVVGGYDVPIVTFIDANADGEFVPADDPVNNTTIDRAYLGYVRLLKESRLLTGTGPAVPTADQQFSTTEKNASSGNVIEYRITYENISEPQLGSGNILLTADQLVLTEDGTANGNTWALDADANGNMDTLNVDSSAVDSNGGTITFFNGAAASSTTAPDVTRYVDTVPGILNPGDDGKFTFRRVID